MIRPATALMVIVSLLGGALSCITLYAQNETGADAETDDREADVQIEAFLSLTRMSYNDSATLTLRLSWDESEFALGERSAPQLDLLRLRVGSVTSRALPFSKGDGGGGGNARGRVIQEYIYTLLPTASGNGVVHPVKIGFIRKADSRSGSVNTAELRVTILMPPPAGEQSGTGWKVMGLNIIAFLALVGVVGTILRYRRRREADKERKLLALNRLIGDLALLKAASSGSKAEFFDTLYEFLYDLLCEAGHVSARKGDSDSVIAELRQAAISDEIKRPLLNWLERSASEKFSPGRGTPGETLRVYYDVDTFIRESWWSTSEPNQVVEPDTETRGQHGRSRD